METANDHSNRRVSLIAFLVFVVYLLHGSTLGPTDDEAYYWILSQKPAMGYAFHPPMVAWLIHLSHSIFDWLGPRFSSFALRLPAALCMLLFLGQAGGWFSDLGLSPKNRAAALLFLLSFAGLFASAWMIVPDVPLMLFWILLFRSNYLWIREEHPSTGSGLGMAVATVGVFLSKFTALLPFGSAWLAVLFFARGRSRIQGLGWLVLGAAIGIIPSLIWNAHHDWGSLRYQFFERHSLAFSWNRGLRFFGLQWALAGFAVGYFGQMVFRTLTSARGTPDADERIRRYVLVWAIPAIGLFFVQAFFSSFKFHWSLVGWLPVFLFWAYRVGQGLDRKFARLQMVFGYGLIALIFILFRVPWTAWCNINPLMGVTNDVMGWSQLREWSKNHPEYGALEVIGSRYQTAGQAAFALREIKPVVLIPRDLKSMDEWPSLESVDSPGLRHPRLLKPVLAIQNARYPYTASFSNPVHCDVLTNLDEVEAGQRLQRISVLLCSPNPAPTPVPAHS